MKDGLRGRGPDERLEQCGPVRNDGNGADLSISGTLCIEFRRQQIVGGDVLRGQDSVHGTQGKLSLVVEKIRQMGLAKARFPGKKRDA